MTEKNTQRGQMALALQGGGSHGAFTWGVLHALLDDARVDWQRIAAVSGTSAGAVNAAVMSVGYVQGKDANSSRLKAQEALAAFWQEVSASGDALPFKPLRMPAGKSAGASSLNAIIDWWSDAAQSYWQQFSPYQTNPLNLNPLRELLKRHLPDKALARWRESRVWQLHLAATDVSTGQPVFFSGDEVTVESVMASACLPMLFQAVQIKERHYWDGGYSANPPLAPLVENETVDAILLVSLSATRRKGLPQSASDITARERDISFSAPFNAEQRLWKALDARLQAEGISATHRLPSLDIISAPKLLNNLDTSSKLDTDEAFLKAMFEAGKKTAQQWLKDPPAI